MWRTYGRRLGVPVVVLDVLKGFVPGVRGVVLVSHLCGMLAGMAAMLGHWRPLFLRFEKGGKMVATGGGVFFAVAPLVAATALVVWAAIFLSLGYASVASMAARSSRRSPRGSRLPSVGDRLRRRSPPSRAAYLHRANICAGCAPAPSRVPASP